VNAGSSLAEGGLDTISAAELSFNDAEQAAAAITYTVTALPQHGELRLNGATLSVNGTFSQVNLNNNTLQYAHDGSDTLNDSFNFSVSDGTGGVVSGQTFHFTIILVNDRSALSTPATITFTRAPGGAVALDGLGGSTDVSGIALAVYFADASRNLLNSGLTFEDPYGVGAVNSGLAVNYSSSAGSQYVIVKSRSAGDNFWLRALQLTDYGGNNLRIEGFNDGVSTGITNVTVNTDPWYFTFEHNGVLLPSIFQNVDEIRIRGQDSSTIWLTINDITIAAAPVSNQNPTDLALSKSSVAQSGGANAVVGTLTTTDADSGDSHTYTLVSGNGGSDNGAFNLAGSSLRANNASVLAAGNYSVRIQTDDGQGGTYSEAFTITVVDDIAPVITSAANASGTNGGLFSYTITANGQATTYGAQGLPTGLTVSALTGEISGTPRQAGTFNVQITAADASGNTDTNGLALAIGKARAVVTLANLNQVYDGTGKSASASTAPSGLTVNLTYNGATVLPVNAGSYEVVGTLNDVNYSGNATNTLVITLPAPAITLSVATNFYSLNGQPTRLDGQALFAALGQELFAGAKLQVTIVSNLGPADLLTFHDQKSGTNRLQAGENTVSFDGVTIATYSGGATGAPSLEFTFTAGATQAGVQELLRNLSFRVGAKDATNLWRELEFTFTDSLEVEAPPVSLALVLNHLPRVGQDRAVTGTNLPVQIPFARLLANDSDRDGDALRVVGFQTNHLRGGTLVTNSTGFFYSPAPGFEGVDQFSYIVSDGKSVQASGIVGVIVLSESKLAIEDADTEPTALPSSSTVVFMGVPGRLYTVEASSDLIQWQPIGTVTPGETGLVKYFDADAVQHHHRFYRTVWQQGPH
jgi:hypothetical protein